MTSTRRPLPRAAATVLLYAGIMTVVSWIAPIHVPPMPAAASPVADVAFAAAEQHARAAAELGHGACVAPGAWQRAQGDRIPAGAIVRDATSVDGPTRWVPLEEAFRMAAAHTVWTVALCAS